MAYTTHEDEQARRRRWSIQFLRAEYQSQPPKLQAETRLRVARMLEAEWLRRQKSQSYLARHAEEIYQP